MYVAMLLTDWCVLFVASSLTHNSLPARNVVSQQVSSGHNNVYIGRSEVAMWMRVVSSWVCMLLYMWSLLAPALFPDRYDRRHSFPKSLLMDFLRCLVLEIFESVLCKLCCLMQLRIYVGE